MDQEKKDVTTNEQEVTKVAESNPETTPEQETEEKVVTVVNGAGTDPIKVPWAEGMTVTGALKAAGIEELEEGEAPVIGEAMVEDPDETLVEPGQMIVIDETPANGSTF